jgi:zinc ribbon protein
MLYGRSMWVRQPRMSAVATSCPSCHHELPPGARFCVGCGRRVARDTISWGVSDRRTFGVLPGRAKMRAARARTQRWLAVVRARMTQAIEVLAAHVEAQLERLQIKRHARLLDRERTKCMHALGEAVYAGSEADARRVRGRLSELDAGIAAAQAALRHTDERTHARIQQARREGGATEAVEPVPVPEPGPVPSPLPGPVPVPELSPVPSDPPGPVIVPEPEPPAAG